MTSEGSGESDPLLVYDVFVENLLMGRERAVNIKYVDTMDDLSPLF